MTRKLLIFGNGLGMALDHHHFSLTAALAEIWDRPNFLRDEQKQLIERCLQHHGAPEGENELDTLYQAVTHCKALNNIGDNDRHWLTEDGRQFPEITATYIHKVATHLHNFDGELPRLFRDNLVEFIKKTKSHVATLNYDKLLYSAFIEDEILKGYKGSLVDGMLNSGFSIAALERKYKNDFGYYLHLHGSPLFIGNGHNCAKLTRDQLTLDRNESSEHVVLTHIKRKPSVIAASTILSTYWSLLGFSLSESEEVILFGYSGLDTHLNNLLQLYMKNIKFRVIEWAGAGDEEARGEYWKNTLGPNVELTRLTNIAEFTNW